jgi:hypothetical protein
MDPARAALGAPKTTMASSPKINSPDTHNPLDRCNCPWVDDCAGVWVPPDARPGLNLSNFWFVAPNETEQSESWFLFIASPQNWFELIALLIWMLISAKSFSIGEQSSL